MTTKKKQNSKVPKSAKTRFSDLTPENDARGGRAGKRPAAERVPPIKYPPPSA